MVNNNEKYVKYEDVVPSRDDYELTLKELRAQKIQLLLQLVAIESGIKAFEVLAYAD